MQLLELRSPGVIRNKLQAQIDSIIQNETKDFPIQFPAAPPEAKIIVPLRFIALYANKLKKDDSSFYGYRYQYGADRSGNNRMILNIKESGTFDPFPKFVEILNLYFLGYTSISPRAMRNDIIAGYYKEQTKRQKYIKTHGQYVQINDQWVARHGRWHILTYRMTGYADYDRGTLTRFKFGSRQNPIIANYDTRGYCTQLLYSDVSHLAIIHYRGPRLHGPMYTTKHYQTILQLDFDHGSLIRDIHIDLNTNYVDSLWFPHGEITFNSAMTVNLQELTEVKYPQEITFNSAMTVDLQRLINLKYEAYTKQLVSMTIRSYPAGIITIEYKYLENFEMFGPHLIMRRKENEDFKVDRIDYWLNDRELTAQQYSQYLAQLSSELDIFPNISVAGVTNIIGSYLDDVNLLNYSQQINDLIQGHR
jgi:hypothetical protein